MTTTHATDEAVLTPELAARLLKLAPAEKRRAIEILEEDSAERHADFWTDMKSRIDAARGGKSQTYTLAESLAHIDAVFGIGGES